MNYLQIKNNEPILYEGDKVISEGLKVIMPELSEDQKKAIGWVDVEALAKLAIPNYENRMDDEIKFAREKFKQGFNAAQSLNERRFTEDDLRKSYGRGFNHRDFESVDDESWKEFENSLSAPKRYPVELETESILVNSKGKPIYPDKPGEWITSPRVENNSIKVLKVRI